MADKTETGMAVQESNPDRSAELQPIKDRDFTNII